MSQLQSEIPVRSWMTQIITTLTNHSPGRTGSSSRTTWTIFSHVASFDGKLFILFKNHNVLSVQNIIRSLIPTNLKVGYFSKGNQGGHLVCLMKWMRIFIYCKQHKRNAINSEKNCCWQDFDALRIQISVAASGHWRNPGIIYQGRDAYWCLSSCTDVHIYYIPFPGDVSRRGMCAPGKWHTEAERSHRIRWLAISAQLLFVR